MWRKNDGLILSAYYPHQNCAVSLPRPPNIPLQVPIKVRLRHVRRGREIAGVAGAWLVMLWECILECVTGPSTVSAWQERRSKSEPSAATWEPQKLARALHGSRKIAAQYHMQKEQTRGAKISDGRGKPMRSMSG